MSFPNAQPAYAPYAQPYVAPRYPLAPIAPSAMAHTGQARMFVADTDPNAPPAPGPLTKEFWMARTFGLPRWSIPLGAAALLAIYSAWGSGMLGGRSRSRSSRDASFFTSGDPRPRRRKKKGPARRRPSRSRGRGRSYGYDL